MQFLSRVRCKHGFRFDSGEFFRKMREMKSVRLLLFASAMALRFTTAPAADNYVLGPDSMPQEGVPRGEVTKYRWTNSTVYPGTVRDWWIYIPKQYSPD